MNKIDTKLVCGIKVGNALKCIDILIHHYGLPPNTTDIISYIDWINTQIPDDIFIECSYPNRSCRDDLIELHLNIFLEEQLYNLSPKEMCEGIKKMDLSLYGYFLQLFKKTYHPPSFYVITYNYN